jgi:ankyrin repeat protein
MAKDIHNAAGYGSLKEIQRFLAAGVDVDLLDADGNTPLLRACRFGQIHAAQLLVNEGASVNASSSGWTGRTPLHVASALGSAPLVEFLLDQGARLEAADDRGWTPLMCAASQGMHSIAKILINRGAKLDAQDKDGYTALVHAFEINSGPYTDRFNVIELLLDRGCNPNLVDAQGKTALDLAIEIDRDSELIARLQKAVGKPVTAEQWDMVGGDECVLCKGLARWKPSKQHPDYIAPDVIESWLGVSPPGRVKFASGTMYRGKVLIKRRRSITGTVKNVPALGNECITTR